MKSSTTMSIGEIASRFGLATHVLRHWETAGLLMPAREGDRRRYGPRDLYRVAMILRVKEAGLSLEEIREIISAGNGERRKEVLRRRKADLTKRIARDQASLDLLQGAIDCPHEDLLTCPAFQSAVTERVDLQESRYLSP